MYINWGVQNVQSEVTPLFPYLLASPCEFYFLLIVHREVTKVILSTHYNNKTVAVLLGEAPLRKVDDRGWHL